ncbi:hypothetical protein [Dyella tabacisoli]|uniref:hypothetical protein n=1 Tax=Dyella tabacisoli TaxID=2282381 RepID=UPI0013B45446|nr:hypothetical protein [Dyella tabacisoli]
MNSRPNTNINKTKANRFIEFLNRLVCTGPAKLLPGVAIASRSLRYLYDNSIIPGGSPQDRTYVAFVSCQHTDNLTLLLEAGVTGIDTAERYHPADVT